MDDEVEARVMRAVKDAHATALAAGLLMVALMETIEALTDGGTEVLSATCDRASQLLAARSDASAEMVTMTEEKLASFRAATPGGRH